MTSLRPSSLSSTTIRKYATRCVDSCERQDCALSRLPRWGNSSITCLRISPGAWFSTSTCLEKAGSSFKRLWPRQIYTLPIIFISGHADVPMSVRAMKRGAIEFLTKPVSDQDLLDAIQLAIAQDRARRDAEQTVAKPGSLLRQADAA